MRDDDGRSVGGPMLAFADRLEGYDRLVEVGVGRRPGLAGELADRGVAVTATDVHQRAVPDGVRFARDDVVDPKLSVYRGAGAIYARNLPPELHRPALAVARAVDADLLFTTLGGDEPAIPVERRTIPGDTLYRSTAGDSRRRR